MKKIIYTRPDGGMSIVHPADQADVAGSVPEVAGMTEDEYLAWIMAKDVPANATNVKIIDAALIPTDRSNRDAWEIA